MIFLQGVVSADGDDLFSAAADESLFEKMDSV